MLYLKINFWPYNSLINPKFFENFFYLQILFIPKRFFGPKNLDFKIFLTKNFLAQKFINLKFIWPKKNFPRNFFRPQNFCWSQRFFWSKILWPKYICFDQKIQETFIRYMYGFGVTFRLHWSHILATFNSYSDWKLFVDMKHQ